MQLKNPFKARTRNTQKIGNSIRIHDWLNFKIQRQRKDNTSHSRNR